MRRFIGRFAVVLLVWNAIGILSRIEYIWGKLWWIWNTVDIQLAGNIVIAAGAAGWLIYDRLKPKQASEATSAPPPASNPDPLSDTLPPPEYLPNGRAIYSCTPERLAAISRANTTDRANKLLLKKWVKFSAEIDDHQGKGRLTLMYRDPIMIPFLIFLEFGEGWEERLSTLQRGSTIIVRGQIVTVDSYLKLADCELL